MARPRGVLIAGNWKMNLGPSEARVFFRELEAKWPTLPKDSVPAFESGRLEACIFVPAVSLSAALENPLPVSVGAQNAHGERSGAFTGELAGPMLAEIGVKWVLLGHSERRQFFGETDAGVLKRMVGLLGQGFRTMVCIGELLEERKSGQTRAVLERQLGALVGDEKGGPDLLSQALASGQLVLAYEPVWAIGTGLTATPDQAREAHELIRSWLGSRCGAEVGERARILYGGSVTPQNIEALLASEGVDGVLVGGASLKPESYLSLVAAGVRAALS